MTAQQADYGWRQTLAPTLALFTSLGTLLCCALPALLVTLGLGAALAGLVTAVPELVWLSRHKALVFGLSGGLILLAGWLTWRARQLPCPVDPGQAAACLRLRRLSAWSLGIAALVWLVGFFFAFLAVHLLM
jgi:hypothetical protein